MKVLILSLTLSFFIINPINTQPNSSVALLSIKDGSKLHSDDINVDTDKSFNYYDSLGFIYYDSRNYLQADSLFGIALNLKQQKLNPYDLKIAFSYHSIGDAKLMLKSYELALNNYQKSLQIRLLHLPQNDDSILSLYKNIAAVYSIILDFDKSIAYLDKVLKILLNNAQECDLHLSNVYIILGKTYNKSNNHINAINVYKQAIKLQSKCLGEDHKNLGESYFGLGIAHNRLRQYDMAVKSYLKSLQIRLKNYDKYHYLIADIYTNLGIIKCNTGEFESAFKYFNQELEAKRNYYGEDHIESARAYNNLGVIRQTIGDYAFAEPYFNKALEIKQKHYKEPNEDLAFSLNNLGSINFSLGFLDEALSYFLRAKEMYLSLKRYKRIDLAYCYHYTGAIYVEKEIYDSAKIYNDQALKLNLEIYGNDHLVVAGSTENAGIIFGKIEKYDSAIHYINKSLLVKRKLLPKHDPKIYSSLQNLAIQYEKNDQTEIADSIWQNTIPSFYKNVISNNLNVSPSQRLNYLNKFQDMNGNFLSFATKYNSTQTNTIATNYILNTKSLALDFSIATEKLIEQVNNPELTDLSIKLNQLTDSITGLNQLRPEEDTKENLYLLSLIEKRDLLSNELLNHPALKSKINIAEINWKDIQDKLSHQEAAIEFIRAYDKETDKQDSSWIYYAIIIQKDQDFPHFVKTTDEATLKKFLKVGDHHYPEFLQQRRLRNQLYKKIWKNLEPYLTDHLTLHISPTGFLYNLSFESLQDDSNKFLGENYEFHYYSTLRNLNNTSSPNTTFEDVLLLGDIDYGFNNSSQLLDHMTSLDSEISQLDRTGINSLPHTLHEINSIKKISIKAGLNTHVFSDKEASEEALNQYLKDNSPNILHFATHGISATTKINEQEGTYMANDNPLQKFALALSGANESTIKNEKFANDPKDGILTASEVINLNLQNTEIVVLSACKTALGEGYNLEGIFGLQRAFKIAGVKVVIASLWDVNDEATKELMTSFYDFLINKKLTSAKALRNAKMQLKEAGYEPADWSGFILIE